MAADRVPICSRLRIERSYHGNCAAERVDRNVGMIDLQNVLLQEEEQRQEEKRREIESIEREIEMVERLKNAGRRSGAICVSVVWDNSVQESDLVSWINLSVINS